MIDPIAFSIGPLAIRWYALAYLIGIALSIGYGMLLVRQKSLWRANTPPYTPMQFMDFLFWSTIGIIIGGRLGYVLFYNPLYFIQNPLDIPAIWQGGMAFHGGLIGIVVAMYLFARHHKASFLSSLDLLGAISPIGLFMGRLANFINAELYGKPTSLPWGIIFPGTDGHPRHPSQLYEAALEGILIFLVLRFVTHIRFGLHRPGLIAGLFGIMYAISRYAVEHVRLPDAHIGYLWNNYLTQGMVLTIPMLLVGIVLLVIGLRQNPSVR